MAQLGVLCASQEENDSTHGRVGSEGVWRWWMAVGKDVESLIEYSVSVQVAQAMDAKEAYSSQKSYCNGVQAKRHKGPLQA